MPCQAEQTMAGRGRAWRGHALAMAYVMARGLICRAGWPAGPAGSHEDRLRGAVGLS